MGRLDPLVPYRLSRPDSGDGLSPRLMPQASPTVLVALRIRSTPAHFRVPGRAGFIACPFERSVTLACLSPASASPKSHFSPSPLRCAAHLGGLPEKPIHAADDNRRARKEGYDRMEISQKKKGTGRHAAGPAEAGYIES